MLFSRRMFYIIIKYNAEVADFKICKDSGCHMNMCVLQCSIHERFRLRKKLETKRGGNIRTGMTKSIIFIIRKINEET